MGKPCVSGAGELRIDYATKILKVAGHTVKERYHHINAPPAEVMLGEIPTVQRSSPPILKR